METCVSGFHHPLNRSSHGGLPAMPSDENCVHKIDYDHDPRFLGAAGVRSSPSSGGATASPS
eukprot:1464532-Prymnesium_polylepis.1